MKVLFTVESYLPARSGMQEVVTQLSERLVKKGYDVTIATSENKARKNAVINGVNIQGFNIEGNSALGYSGDVEAYKQYLLTADFDIMVNFAAQQWATDIVLPLIKEIKAQKVFVPTGFSGLNHPLYESYYKEMGKWLHDYDMNVFLSNDYRDINFAREHGIDKYVIIPNGAATEDFEKILVTDIRQQLGIGEGQFMLLHVGAFSGAKGQMEAIALFNKANIKDAVLVLAGNDSRRRNTFSAGIRNFIKFVLSGVTKLRPMGMKYYEIAAGLSNNFHVGNRLRRKKIRVVELDRSSVIAAFASADLFLFPSMIECSPIVLFECLAGKTPFLTADVGNATEIIDWTGAGMVMPTNIGENGMSYVDVTASVPLLEKVWKDESIRTEMAEKGHRAFMESFTWDKITDKYEDLFMQLSKQ